MSGNHEKRRFERFDTDGTIWVRPLDHSDEFQLLESVNISAGGILFDLDYPLSMAQKMDIRFELPQHPDLIEAVGEVVRVDTKSATDHHIAVHFEKVINLDIDTLMAYLEAVYKQ